MRSKVVFVAVAIVILAGAAFVIVRPSKSDIMIKDGAGATTPIPIGSTASVAIGHAAKGMLSTCLTKNDDAETAVRSDDYLIDGKDSAFDLATTMGIIDVPAGTNVDESIHSYDGKNVTGSIAYPKKYGTYNFTIVPNTKTKPYHQWNMTSLIACR